MNVTDLGNNLRNCRKARKLTQAQVAKKLGVAKQTINKYELGIIENIPLMRLLQLAEIYNLSIAQLVGEEEIDDRCSLKEHSEKNQTEKYSRAKKIEIIATSEAEEIIKQLEKVSLLKIINVN